MSARTILNPPLNTTLSGPSLSITQVDTLTTDITITPSAFTSAGYTFPIEYTVAPTSILVNIGTTGGTITYNILSISKEEFQLAYFNGSTGSTTINTVYFTAFGGTLSN
jgi:hypothetical protein